MSKLASGDQWWVLYLHNKNEPSSNKTPKGFQYLWTSFFLYNKEHLGDIYMYIVFEIQYL